ncbi:ATP-binding protein [Pontibacter sp. SGAir0037]|uniref:sensor histidine kinase n=1 Tax=Pontibacter sp. SGAir0037 TaxID=2571030 RepID=UPI0010CCC9ED|nr:PAS domain-containing sensor histidine kinase [Pontibacter sp. SGAir0037]QCR24641.1 PAS domain-containing sensor histidine kinase [Pontibacter sp. SGAir0037]
MDKQELAERLQTNFIDQVKDYAIFAMDTKGVIVTWNIGAERLKGYGEEEIIGQFYGVLFPETYQQGGKPEEEIALALQNGSYEAHDWRRRKDGAYFWADVTLTPIYGSDGQHIGFTKVTGDITKQKEIQDELAQRHNALKDKNSELQRINLDLDNFVYTASHDLRSPITNIEGLIQFMKEDLLETGCLSAETEHLLELVINSVNRFKRTIEDLTEVSKLQKDATERLSEEVIDIQEVFQNIKEDLVYPSGRREFFVKTDFQVHQLKFSRKNFRSVLSNLLSNAVKYRSTERDCLIDVETYLEKGFVVLKVKDNGLGMEKDHLGKLFTMFQRFHDHVEGTGIGLFMVKRIVENAGGRIEAKSEAGVGSEFKVYFPAAL